MQTYILSMSIFFPMLALAVRVFSFKWLPPWLEIKAAVLPIDSDQTGF